MHLHEYQAKILLESFGIPIPPFKCLSHLEELEGALQALNLQEAVLKVQVHAGGRGKAGGVKIAKNREEIEKFAKELLGMRIVNAQTGPEGVLAHSLLLSPLIHFEKEFYISIAIDRKEASQLLICSPEGGMEIEELAIKEPQKILKTVIPLNGQLSDSQLLEIAEFMHWKNIAKEEGMKLCQNLSKAFSTLDATLLEINPLVALHDGTLLALDAKLTIDDNALFRHPELLPYKDLTQVNPLEALADELGLSYVAMEGDIGCMVNGAGLAMATMDIIDHFGGKPANFLDIGGGASQEKVAEGFRIILKDSKVKAVLVNIFGGIMNCETLANGLISAFQEAKKAPPLILRMEGTNVEEARLLLSASDLRFEVADDLSDAAKKAVEAGKGSY